MELRNVGILAQHYTASQPRRTMKLINSMEQSHSEANSRSASQKLPFLPRNLKFHHRVHKNPPSIHVTRNVLRIFMGKYLESGCIEDR
jgi:hypothetical protein